MKKIALALAILAASASFANAATRQTVPFPFSDHWHRNILVTTVVGCVGGAIVGAKTGWIGGAHGIATGTALGCSIGGVVGMTFPHSRF